MNDETLAQVVQAFQPGGRLLRAWPLAGGISAQTTALEVAQPGGGTARYVVRQHSDVERQRNPNITADEFRLLHILHTAGIPVPRPVHLDTSTGLLPTPYLITEYIDAAPEFSPGHLSGYLRQFAATLAMIHHLNLADFDLSFLPQQEKPGHPPAVLDDSVQEGRIRQALETHWPPPHPNRTALLHGDYWPGNTLWREGQLVAVVDWEDATLGDPLEDVSNGRLEILWAFGPAAMHTFTQHYHAAAPDVSLNHLPLWDLCAALRPAAKIHTWGLDAETERTFRQRHSWFVNHIFSRLPG